MTTPAQPQPELKLGMIGLDSMHVIWLTALLNHPSMPGHIPGARVAFAYKGGSPDMPRSWSRVEGFAAELREKHGVILVDSIAELITRCDAILIMSVDGRAHLALCQEVFGRGKPVFVDKPLATTLKEAAEIVRLSRTTGTPFFSSSSFRFTAGVRRLRAASLGRIRGAVSYGDATAAPPMPGLFYEGIHPVEALYTVLGRGCISLTSIRTEDSEVVAGIWTQGRTGTVYGLRHGDVSFGMTVFGEKAHASETEYAGEGFGPLAREIIAFFQTGRSPLAPEETLEIIAFMEAAGQSQHASGAPVSVAQLLSVIEPLTH